MDINEWKWYFGPYDDQEYNKADMDLFMCRKMEEYEWRLVMHDNGRWYIEKRRKVAKGA